MWLSGLSAGVQTENFLKGLNVCQEGTKRLITIQIPTVSEERHHSLTPSCSQSLVGAIHTSSPPAGHSEDLPVLEPSEQGLFPSSSSAHSFTCPPSLLPPPPALSQGAGLRCQPQTHQLASDSPP